ncbi:MAG: hypothetical protein LBL81_01945 [Tannerella sp.]|jgi:cell division protein FtsA|nr:hypothetical protein [Tannerella sp.]
MTTITTTPTSTAKIYSDFIVAIHLGTDNLIGLIGRRVEYNNSYALMDYVTEPAEGCMRRGCIYNVKKTEKKVKDLLAKLRQSIPGSLIDKVYLGFGGQSLHSVEQVVRRSLEPNTAVSEILMNDLNEAGRDRHTDGLDVLDVLPPACFLEGRLEKNPVGTVCHDLEACYQQLCARTSIHRQLETLLTKSPSLAKVLVSPLALADVLLTEDEKEMGCLLIDFDWGVTTASLYRDGQLQGLCTIPLGCRLVVKDLSSHFSIIETDAEACLLYNGHALADENDTSNFSINTIDRKGLRSVDTKEFDEVTEARLQEIIRNVEARIKDFLDERAKNNLGDYLHAGVIITGYGARIPRMEEAVMQVFPLDAQSRNRVRDDIKVKILKGDLKEEDINPQAIGLLVTATGEPYYLNCAGAIPKPPVAPPVVTPPVATPPAPPKAEESKQEPQPEAEPPKQPKETKKKSWFDKAKEKAKTGMGGLFDDVE